MLWGLPYALLLLLGAIPLILFLHSLKPKARRISTTTLFLWERVLRERPLATRLGWLFKKNLLLILQILAALLLILALADPSLLHVGGRPGDVVVVMDLSASMKAKGPLGTRFDAARKEFLSLVEQLGSDQKMMVIGAAAQARLMIPFTTDKHRLRDLGRGLGATDAPGQVKEAILFAYAFLKRGSADRVVVITDGAFDGAEDFTRQAAHLQFIRVEGGKENVGIVGFEARGHPDRPTHTEVMVHVRNFTAKPLTVPLTLMLGEKILAQEAVEIEAEGRRILIYRLEERLAGTLVARLEIEDDFATDNAAYLVVTEAAPVRLLYVGPGNPYLERLLRLFPQVHMTAAEQWDASRAAESYDLVIFDRVSVPALAQGNFILIHTNAPNLPLEMAGTVQTSRVITPLPKHPITDGLGLGDLSVRESLRMVTKGEGSVLARSAETPLLFALERGDLRLLLIGFDLMASDLPLRVAFPLLFHNAFEWFQPRRLEFPAQSIQAGSPFMLRLPTADRELEITRPGGNREVFKVLADPFVLADTMEVGFYTYKSASRAGRFAVNLCDERESQIASRLQLDATPGQTSQAATAQEAGFSLWPWLLAAVLVVLALEIFLAYRNGTPVYPIAARGLAFATLALALFNPRIFRATDALDVIVTVDLSRSVGQEGREKASEVLEAASRVKDSEKRTGLLLFARSPEWEFVPRQTISLTDFTSQLDRDETDIQAALQAAVAQIGEGRQGRILLISDGNENRGEINRVLPLLRAHGAQVWTLPVNLWRGRNEVYVSDLVLPQQVDSAETFEVKATIESLRDSSARVKLLRNGVLQYERELQLTAGANSVGFRDRLSERGSHTYELLVDSPDDTLAENNLLQGIVEVKGPPRVLLLSSQKESQRFFSQVLRTQGYSVVEGSPEAYPLALSELSSFDLLVLDNVPAFQLSHAKMESIEKYVRDLGGGLLVIGGSQSYGAGGYYRTPLERVLPVEMRPPARLDLPHVTLLFVIDKSGSMAAGPEGTSKLDLAKAAIIAAADVMNPNDHVGILAFDAATDWVVPFRPVGRGEWLSERLAAIQADGGTDIYKALVEAYRAMTTQHAAIKHVLVLSDGITDKADFRGLAARMARDNITVSTVSVGYDADIPLLAEIAKHGKGRGYVTLDPQTIPQIFTTETLLISRDLLVEKTVTPTVTAWSGPLKGLTRAGWPPLRGYVVTYPKPNAELLMNVEKDPLLVSWRYGLGRVLAFTSDLSGRWGREWVTWQGFPQWASQLARHAMRTVMPTTVQAQFQSKGDSVKVIADVRSKEGEFVNHLKLRGNITAPNRATAEEPFQQSAPGRYQARFLPSQRGVHLLTLYADSSGGEEPLALATVPYVAPYPREYRELKPDLALLNRLTEETGGEMLNPEKIDAGVKRLYTSSPGKATLGKETWWPLAGLGLLLFLADLVLRSWPSLGRADRVLTPA